VRDAQELEAVVAKIVAFGHGQGRSRSLLTYTDVDPESDFEATAQEMLAKVPAGYRVDWVRRRESGSGTRDRLLAALAEGPLVVNYVGHGSEDLWSGSVLTSGDARTLRNTDHPMVLLAMTCLNGVFQSVWKTGVAEAMLLADRGGAVAAFASSGLTYASDQAVLNQKLLDGLLGRGLTLGEAILQAKAEVTDPDVQNSWILLGDPAMRIAGSDSPPPAATGSSGAPTAPSDAKAARRPGSGCCFGETAAADGRPGWALLLVLVGALLPRRRRPRQA
jgi:MYXO-CTERM domain-containing protein